MTAPLFSLLAVTVGFWLLVFWVYHPRNRARMQDHARIPLQDEERHEDLDKSCNEGETPGDGRGAGR